MVGAEGKDVSHIGLTLVRNNLHNGVVSGAARGQALLGPMWAGLTPDSKGDPTSDTEEPDRRRQETPHLSARRKALEPLRVSSPASPRNFESPCTREREREREGQGEIY